MPAVARMVIAAERAGRSMWRTYHTPPGYTAIDANCDLCDHAPGQLCLLIPLRGRTVSQLMRMELRLYPVSAWSVRDRLRSDLLLGFQDQPPITSDANGHLGGVKCPGGLELDKQTPIA
jgi:hypothetical protein